MPCLPAALYTKPMDRTSLPLLLLATQLCGCVLPLGTAAPQPSTTAGKGGFTVGGRAEVPTIDLLETQGTSEDYQLTPFPVASFEFGYGIADTLDIEASLDVAVLIIVPAPLGGSVGLRQQVLRTPDLAIAAAGRVGYASMSNDDADASYDPRRVSAIYGLGTLSATLNPDGWLSPGLSMSYYGLSIEDDPRDGPSDRFFSNLGTATLYLDLTSGSSHLGPFVNFIAVDSPSLGVDVLVTAGLFVYARFGAPPPVAPPPAAAGSL